MIAHMKTFLFKLFFIIPVLISSCIYGKSIQTCNKVLANVGKASITVLDVKKEMDRQIYMKDKKLFNNIDAIASYYHQNWKPVLQKFVQDEILLLEAESLKYEIPSHEINKKITELFGEKEVESYRFLSITPKHAETCGKREVISSHLSWYQIWSKSYLAATPKMINGAYEDYISSLSNEDKWTYQALYIKGNDKKIIEDTSKSITNLLATTKLTNLSAILEKIDLKDENLTVRVSQDITLQTNQLSSSLLNTLESLEEGNISDLIIGKRSNAYTGKVIHLKEYEKAHIPELSEVTDRIKNSIINEKGEQLSIKYFSALYKKIRC